MAGNEPASNAPRDAAEERLLIEAAQRDPARFADLYENHFEQVYAFVVRRVRDRETAEDLTAGVFHKALESLPRFSWRGVPFGAWLLKIAANMVADQRRKLGKEKRILNPEDVEVGEPEVAQSNLEEVESSARLFQLVRRLPKDQQRVIELRFGDEKSIGEIARDLGRSEGAIKQLQFRALENLRSRLRGERDE